MGNRKQARLAWGLLRRLAGQGPGSIIVGHSAHKACCTVWLGAGLGNSYCSLCLLAGINPFSSFLAFVLLLTNIQQLALQKEKP